MKKRAAIIVLIYAFFALSGVSAKDVSEHTPTPEPTPQTVDWRDYYAEHPEELKSIAESHDMGRAAGMICPLGASDECLSAVMCCIYNRARTAGFPDDISAVCTQKNQWMYQNSKTATPEIYSLAKNNLNEWTADINSLPIPSNMVFIVADTKGFWFRSDWYGENELFVYYYE